MKKPIIEYPCRWSYRIIGSDESSMRSAVAECMKKTKYELTASNASRSGKYISLNLVTVVSDEEVRNRLYVDLKSMSCIKMVL